jgi:hypothetical protein
MDAELKNLKIDRSKRRSAEPSKWATRWIVIGILIFLLLGAWRLVSERLNAAQEVEVQRVRSISGQRPEAWCATGYIGGAQGQVAPKWSAR